METNEEISEILGQGIDVKAAIQIAKIVSHAPEERLPMILDIFNQAGIEISGMEMIEALREAAKKKMQIEDIEGFLEEITKRFPAVNGEHRIPVKAFNCFCEKRGLNDLNVRRTLAEMALIRISIYATGKQNFSVSVYLPEKKQLARCVCITAYWREILGVEL